MAINTGNWRSVTSKSPGEIEAEFDDISSIYDKKVETMGYMAPKDSADLLAKYLTNKDAHILDAGCGTGLVGAHLKEHGFTRITGVDISSSSLAEAEKKKAYMHTQKHNLLEPFPFGDNTFNGITCIGVWSRFSETEILSMLKEFERISAKDAVILISHRKDLLNASGLIDTIQKDQHTNLKLELVTRPYPYMEFDKNYHDVQVKYLILRKV